MVNVVQHDTRAVTTDVVMILAVAAGLFTLLSVGIIYGITHSLYTAGYYTISALFDAVGVDVSTSLSTLAAPYTGAFYEVVAVSILDGLVKTVIVGFVLAAIINAISTIDLQARLSGITKRRLKDHVILCGYSSLGERIAHTMRERKIPFVVVAKSKEKADEAREAGFPVLHEDFTTDEALRNAEISKAKAIIFMRSDDYDNLLGVITAHHLNSKVRIISKAQDIGAVTKIHRAGAELCVVPEMLAGIELGEAILTRK